MRLSTFLPFFFFLSLALPSNAQSIKAPRGFAPQVGTLMYQLDDLKGRVTRSVRSLDQAGTDFLLDDQANRVGAMIQHLAAVEVYYQVLTFENRGFNAEEQAKWGLALDLGGKAREKLVDQPISYYLDQWDEVRRRTTELLKTRDDKWLADKVSGYSMNNHWAWYHVMEHQANHMGQIRMIVKRIP